MKSYEVSILVPVYNVGSFIVRCAESLFRQTYKNIEYIFVDDASPDNSIELLRQVIKKYPERKDDVTILTHSVNRGLSAARNTAVRAAKGNYVMHIDSDDYIALDGIERMLKYAQKKDADVVVADDIITTAKKKHRKKDVVDSDKKAYINQLLFRESNYRIGGKLLRRSLLLQNALFSVEHISMGEDYVLYPRIVYYAKNIVKLDYAFYYYYQNANSLMHTVSRNSLQNLIDSEEYLISFFKKQFDFLTPDEINISRINTKKQMYALGNLKDYAFIHEYAQDISYKGIRIPVLVKLLLLFDKRQWFLPIYGMFRLKKIADKIFF